MISQKYQNQFQESRLKTKCIIENLVNHQIPI